MKVIPFRCGPIDGSLRLTKQTLYQKSYLLCPQKDIERDMGKLTVQRQADLYTTSKFFHSIYSHAPRQ